MQIASLHRYPIKGCRGQLVTTVEIDDLGVVGDRRLMLVDSGGGFLSQRELPVLATIEPAIDGTLLSVQQAGVATLNHELDPDGQPTSVSLWRDTIIAHDQGDDAAAWFSSAVGLPCRLVMYGKESYREIDPKWSVRPGAETAFADGYPLMVVVEASLAALNAVLDVPVPIGRFRPSLVVSGVAAWSESEWTTIALGSMIVDAVKPCARCLVPTTDQFTGERALDQEPLRTLARLRTTPRLGAIFGQNLMPRGPGTLSTGDRVALQM